MHTRQMISLLFLSSTPLVMQSIIAAALAVPFIFITFTISPLHMEANNKFSGRSHDSIPFNIFLLPVALGCRCLETGRHSFPDLVWWSHKGQWAAVTSVTQRHCDETRPPEASATGRFKRHQSRAPLLLRQGRKLDGSTAHFSSAVMCDEEKRCEELQC